MVTHNVNCDQCSEVFKSKMKLSDHKRVKHSYWCEECNAKFEDKEKLEVHVEEHIFKCDKCAEECDTKMKGLDHKKTVHVFKYALTGKLLIVFIIHLLTDCSRFSGWE